MPFFKIQNCFAFVTVLYLNDILFNLKCRNPFGSNPRWSSVLFECGNVTKLSFNMKLECMLTIPNIALTRKEWKDEVSFYRKRRRFYVILFNLCANVDVLIVFLVSVYGGGY